MANYSSKDVILLIDGFDVLGQQTELTQSVEAETQEQTPYGAEWAEIVYTGVKRAEIMQSGFYDDAAVGTNEALNEKQGDTRILCFGYEGNTAGKRFTGAGGAIESRFDRAASINGIHKATASYAVSGAVEGGRVILPLSVKTEAGNTEDASIDNGAESTGGAALYLQVSALDLDGYDNIVVKVRSSTNDTTFADLQAFTAATAMSAQRILKTGTIPRYLAVSWAFTGTGTEPSATIFVGAARL